MTLDWENIEQVQKVIKNSEWLRDELQISKEQLTLLTEMTGYIEFMLIGKFVFGVREILWKIKMDKGDTIYIIFFIGLDIYQMHRTFSIKKQNHNF